jgi:hypothetical protein
VGTIPAKSFQHMHADRRCTGSAAVAHGKIGAL